MAHKRTFVIAELSLYVIPHLAQLIASYLVLVDSIYHFPSFSISILFLYQKKDIIVGGRTDIH